MLRGLGTVSVILLLSLTVVTAAAENVKVGIPSLTVTMMPLAVARERGFFQQEGLNVDLVLMPAALNIKVLLSGDLDYATTVGSAVVGALAGSRPENRLNRVKPHSLTLIRQKLRDENGKRRR